MLRLIRFLPTRWWSPKAWLEWRRYAAWRIETWQGKESPKFSLRRIRDYLEWLKTLDHLAGKHP